MSPSRWGVSILLAACLLSVAVPALARRSVASQQLDIARSLLEQAAFLDALASAESALRADSDLIGATVVKALAYEGLGAFDVAEALLTAFAAEAPDAATRLGVGDTLARVQGRPADEGLPTEEQLNRFIADDDPDPWLDRVDRAIDVGRCEAAAAAAAELTFWRRAEPGSWTRAGAAARCAGDYRRAVLAYRRYGELGGQDPQIADVLASLEEGLATVEVAVTLQEGSGEPVLRLDLGGERITPNGLDHRLRFADLSIGLPMTLTVAGRGLGTETIELEPLAPGEVRSLDVAPTWIGLGTVRLVDYLPGGLEVTLRAPAGELTAVPGGSFEVTAGTVVAVISTDKGSLERAIEVQNGQTVDLDPTSHLPSALTVVDLPAGSQVRLFVEGEGGDTEQRVQIPFEVGGFDPETGLRLAPPRRFWSLPGGSGTLFVEHPVLGSGRTPIALISGESNAITFAWKAMDGLPGLRARYRDWQARRAIAESGRQRTAALGAASAVLAGLGGGLLVGGAIAGGQAEALRLDLDNRFDNNECTDDQGGVLQSCREDQGAVRQGQQARDGLAVAGSITVGVGAVGFGITIAMGATTRAALAEVGDWEPFPRE